MKNPSLLLFGLLVSVLFFGWGCNNGNLQGGDRLLAEVSGKSLFLSDMEGMIPEGMSAEDSTLIIDAYVNRWIRDAILLVEAERNVPADLDINKLVEDYRSSLLLDNYKKALMEESLDSTVTSEELQAFYDNHREGYYLENDIISAYFMIIPRNTPDIGKVRSWWSNMSPESLLELRSYCTNNGTHCFLDENSWFSVEELAAQWPRGTVNDRDLWNEKDLQRQDDEFFYFYYRVDKMTSGEIAPMEYVEDQIKRLILHQRKIRLVEETQDKMYERALRNKAVRVY
ncbi:MAG: hypothetical protein KDC34_12150 [Saprospiraceae bacterium]|nr:hypothetical protein [Saprospiraceae bacterium]